jgi:phosphoribosyl 1,2-cyclic phosphodiesterase
MALRFTVLASGSSGNVSLLEADGRGVLIDAGLGPRVLTSRLEAVGASWDTVRAVLLTHTHTDHWKETTLAHLLRRRVFLYCHSGHHGHLGYYSSAFAAMHSQELVRGYEPGRELVLSEALRCRPFALKHDGGATFGFRFEGKTASGSPGSLAYVADLGCWDAELVAHLLDVDVLALEFNHDVALEKNSGRSPALIARVLGDRGHLSNGQAAALLREVRQRSAPGRLQHVVQLHLSRDCNRPALAAAAARAVLDEWPECVAVHTACQDRPGPRLTLGVPGDGGRSPRRNGAGRARRSAAHHQPLLPGWDDVYR